MAGWTSIVLMPTYVDDDGTQNYQIIHGSTLLNTLIDYSEGKFDMTEEERTWIGSRKIRVLVYDNLTLDESAAVVTHSDLFRATNETNGKLSVLNIEGRVFEGQE